MKPLIGITTAMVPNKYTWGPDAYSQNQQYVDAVLTAGGVPVLLPFTHTTEELRALYGELDGLLFAGGGDVDSSEYDEPAADVLKDVNPERDRIELQLIKWAIADDKPVLAICRGHQVLNVALGGTLYQDIPSMIANAQNHDLSTEKEDRAFIAHRLVIAEDSRLARILGSQPIGANTHHPQAIKKLAPGLTVTARAEDQMIEAIELSRSRFVIGIQCHPESLTVSESRWAKLFREFIRAAMPYAISENARNSASTDVALEAL
jgi:putative glutamine amidotransferase